LDIYIYSQYKDDLLQFRINIVQVSG